MSILQEDPEVLATELLGHLTKVLSDPVSHTLDTDLVHRTTTSLTPSTPQPLLLQLIQSGESILPYLTSDPTPLTRLLSQTITYLPLPTLQPLIHPTKLTEGLTSNIAPIQVLCLSYISKASSTPSGAALIANEPELSTTLISTWLSTASTEVADRSLDTIISLLQIDQPPPSPSEPFAEPLPLFWRRLFKSRQTYTQLLAYTTPIQPLTAHLHPSPSPLTASSPKHGWQHATTISQGRLLDFVVRLATLNFPCILEPAIPEIETRYTHFPSTSNPNPASSYTGLVAYASGIVDTIDPLMAVLREDFFAHLLGIVDDDKTGKLGMLLPMGLLQAMREDAGSSYQPRHANGDGGMDL